MTQSLIYKEPHLLTVQQLANHPRFPWLTESALRHHIYDADPRVNSLGETIEGNGLDVALVRIGRRVLIDLYAFETWVMSHKELG